MRHLKCIIWASSGRNNLHYICGIIGGKNPIIRADPAPYSVHLCMPAAPSRALLSCMGINACSLLTERLTWAYLWLTHRTQTEFDNIIMLLASHLNPPASACLCSTITNRVPPQRHRAKVTNPNLLLWWWWWFGEGGEVNAVIWERWHKKARIERNLKRVTLIPSTYKHPVPIGDVLASQQWLQ